MDLKALLTGASWLWLPLFLAACVAMGFHNSYASSAGSEVTSCPGASQMERFLGCP